MGQVVPLPTTYNGVKYRSRTEARWAVFFHALGVQANYEPESFDLAGVWYLPDFHIPAWNLYIEVKGIPPNEEEHTKARLLASASEVPVLIVVGEPGHGRGKLYDPSRASMWDEESPDNAYLATCRRCDRITLFHEWYSDADTWGFTPLDGQCGNPGKCGDRAPGRNEKFAASINLALSHQFDHRKAAE